MPRTTRMIATPLVVVAALAVAMTFAGTSSTEEPQPWIYTWNEPGSPEFTVKGWEFQPGYATIQYGKDSRKVSVPQNGHFQTQVDFRRAPQGRFETITIAQEDDVITENVNVPGHAEMVLHEPTPKKAGFRDYITLSGSGWDKSETLPFHTRARVIQVTASSSNNVQKAHIRLNRWGGFQYVYRIPSSSHAGDTIVFTVSDGARTLSRSVELVQPVLFDKEWNITNQLHADVEDTLTIRIADLQPFAPVELKIGDRAITPYPHDTTDSEGHYETEITVPHEPGKQYLTITTAMGRGFAQAKATLFIYPE